MKKILLSLIFVLLVLQGISQQNFRLHVQPGKPQLAGDGDDYTTMVVTARDGEGEVITSMNGTVALRCSAGFLDESQLKMTNGIAYVKYTAPILGQPIKTSQRMIYFLVKFIRKFLSRFNGSTDQASNSKLATEIAIETIKEGSNPFAMITKGDKDNFAYFVCEMNGVKGKTKIEIIKSTEGGNSSIAPGYYSGYDITGSAPFNLIIESGGSGEMNQGGTEANTILFTNESATEFNSVMVKMIGGGGFMNAYLGPGPSEMKYVENYDIRKQGLPSFYLPMPNNGIFMYIPPILFEYQGRPKVTIPTAGSDGTAGAEQEKKERVFVTLRQNELIGDGRSQTRAVFHYESMDGVPVSGKSIRWSIPKDLKIISVQSVTDAAGNAVAVLQAPILKATDEKRGEMWGQIIDNTRGFNILVNYSTPRKPIESVQTNLTVFKTIEKNIRILKAGFETTPVKILLPQLEQYQLESSIVALVEMINSPSVPDKLAVNDAVVMVERANFDTELFNRKYELYFKKERQNFISGMNVKKGGFIAITDSKGNFKLVVGGNSERKLSMEPLQAKLSDLTGRRKGELGKTLKLFEDPEFVNKVIDGFFKMDKDLCTQKAEKAVMVEEKLHIIGMLMVNANTGDKLIKDTGDELMGHGWELMKTLAEYANSKWNITDKLYKKMKLDKVADKLDAYGKQVKKSTGLDKIDIISDSLTKLGLHYENAFWKSALAKDDYKYGTKKIIQYFLAETVLPEGAKNADKAKASAVYYKLMGDYGGELAGKVWEQLSESISEALAGYVVPDRVKTNYDKASKYVEETQKAATDYVPDKIKEAIQAAYYSSMKEHILRFFDQSPENVHLVYTDLQPALRDRSTDLRAYYSSVAAWRYSAEMLKAYIDLGIDLVVKSIIVIVDGYSGNWTSIAGHMKKLDEGKSAIGTAFTSGSFALEVYRLNNLWAEVLSSFVYVNKSIAQGNTKTTSMENNSWSPFPSAYAALPGRIASVNLTIPNADQLKYSANGLPLAGLNAVFANSSQLESWLEDNMPAINRLAFTKPDEVTALFENVSKYRTFSEQLAVLSIAVAADPQNTALAAEFNKTASDAAINGKELKEATGSATMAMNELPFDPGVNKLPEQKSIFAAFNNRQLIYIGSGLGGLLIILVTLGMIRRKRRKSTSTNNPVVPASPAPSPTPVTPSPHPAIQSQPTQSSPKFCPHCGAPFKTGAKFCSKCGYKTI